MCATNGSNLIACTICTHMHLEWNWRSLVSVTKKGKSQVSAVVDGHRSGKELPRSRCEVSSVVERSPVVTF